MSDSLESLGLSAPKDSLGSLGIVPTQSPSPAAEPSLNLRPAEQADWRTTMVNRGFFANDPMGSKNYLQSQGFQPLTADGEQPSNGMIGDMVADIPRMVAMGLGGAGGLAVGGLSGGPVGATAGLATGGGVGGGAMSAGLSALGGELLDVESSPGMAALGGAQEGAIGELGGKVAGKVIGKAVNLFRDSIDIPQGLALLKNLFKIPNKELGADVAGAAANKASSLGLDGEIDQVLTSPEIIGLMKTAKAAPGNSLQILGANTEKAVSQAGQELSGIVDDAGNVIKPGIVTKINANPNSAIGWDELQSAAAEFTDETLQNLSLANEGGDLVRRGSIIRHDIENNLAAFKERLISGAEKEATSLKSQITLLNEGGKDETGAVYEGLNSLKAKLEPLQKLKDDGLELKGKPLQQYQDLVTKVNEQQKLVDEVSSKYLSTLAQVENPKVSFKDFDDYKTAIGKLANFNRIEGKADLAEAWKNYYGKFSSFVKAHALAVDQNLGTEFTAASERYSKLSDFQKIIQESVGAASKQSQATGLAPDGIWDATKKGAGAVGDVLGRIISPIAKPSLQSAGLVLRDLSDNSPLNLNAQFGRAIRKLPDLSDPSAKFRGNMLTNWAAETAPSNAAAPIFGLPIARNISPYLTPPSAGAQEHDITPLKNGITLSVLIDSGMAPPDARQAGFSPSQVPPEQMMGVNETVMKVLQPLNDAMKFGGEDEIGAAYSQVMKQFPELFPPPKTGIKGEVQINNKIKLFDPADRARYAQQIQLDSGLDWSEKAKIVSELNHSFTVENPRRAK